MARVTGFTCDNPNCKVFVALPENVNLPNGWISIIPQPGDKDTRQQLSVCSNRCLVEIAMERFEGEHGSPYRKASVRTSYRRNGSTVELLTCDDATLSEYGITGVDTCGKQVKGVLGMSIHLTKIHNVAGGLGIGQKRAREKEVINL